MVRSPRDPARPIHRIWRYLFARSVEANCSYSLQGGNPVTNSLTE
jgi:hypothetical protein